MSNYVFTPRLNDAGMVNNPFWYSQNPFYQAGYGLPNCTDYAWGRVWEILAESGAYADPRSEVYNNLCPNFQNAYTWYADTRWTLSAEPALGAVAVYDSIDSSGLIIPNPGHVAVVEEMPDSNTVVFSESHYNGAYFQTRTGTRAGGWADGYLIQIKGFIILPISIEPSDYSNIILFLALLRKRRKKKVGFV